MKVSQCDTTVRAASVKNDFAWDSKLQYAPVTPERELMTKIFYS